MYKIFGSEGSDKPAYTCSVARILSSHIHKGGKQGKAQAKYYTSSPAGYIRLGVEQWLSGRVLDSRPRGCGNTALCP